jgi:hypothetical protein
MDQLEPNTQRSDEEIRHQYLSAAKAKEMLGWSQYFTR